MNVEQARKFLLSLPHVVETEQWGGLLHWVGDKAVGGKMFTMLNLEMGENPIAYPAGPERFHAICEIDGLIPAPYLARAHWVAAQRWDVWRNVEWQDELRAAHALTYEKLPPKVKLTLALPKAELKKVVAERRAILAAKALKLTTDKKDKKRIEADS